GDPGSVRDRRQSLVDRQLERGQSLLLLVRQCGAHRPQGPGAAPWVGERGRADGPADGGVGAAAEGDGGWVVGEGAAVGPGVALACIEMSRAAPGGVVLACKARAPQTARGASTRKQTSANMRSRPDMRFFPLVESSLAGAHRPA